MDKLIITINKLQDAFAMLNQSPISLPQIAVVGGQSAGKSSVLENIVGRDFLPRGSGICTRRPLVLQLIQTQCSQDYAEFLHMPDKKFTNFEHVRKEIEDETDRSTGTNKGISNVSINLKIYSPNVLNLTLVDLPGITRVPVGDQPKDIADLIQNMVENFVVDENVIILAVTAANQDLANSDAIRVAKQVDPNGDRTIGVITKLDLMDKGTDAMEILENKLVPLKLGYVGVVNRSQADINSKMAITKAWGAEKEFFHTHPKYCQVEERMGTPFLAKKLNLTLIGHIKKCLPEISSQVTALILAKQEELKKYNSLNPREKERLLLGGLVEFSRGLEDALKGDNASVHDSSLQGGAKLSHIMTNDFNATITAIGIMDGFTDDDLKNLIRNCVGMRSGLFVPEEAFTKLIKRGIDLLKAPCLELVQRLTAEMVVIIGNIDVPLFARFPATQDAFVNEANMFLSHHSTPAQALVETLVDMEKAWINTHHPDFLGAQRTFGELKNSGLGDEEKSPQQGKKIEMLRGILSKQAAATGLFERVSCVLRDRKLDMESLEGGTPSASPASSSGRNLLPFGKKPAPPPLPKPPPRGANTASRNTSLSLAGANVRFVTKSPKGATFEVSCEDGITTTFTADQPTAEKWVHSLSIATNKNNWDAYTGASRSQQNIQPISEEKDDATVMRALIESMFQIVKRKIADSVPKACIYTLVDRVKRELHTEMVAKLYNADNVTLLCEEGEDNEKKRGECERMLDLLGQSKTAIDSVMRSREC